MCCDEVFISRSKFASFSWQGIKIAMNSIFARLVIWNSSILQACLSFDIDLTPTTINDATTTTSFGRQCVHDVPVNVLPRRLWSNYGEPVMKDPDIRLTSISLNPKGIVESCRRKNFSKRLFLDLLWLMEKAAGKKPDKFKTLRSLCRHDRGTRARSSWNLSSASKSASFYR